MDAGAINTFLDQFLGLADSGFGLIRGDVGYVLNALIVISIVLSGVQWILAAEAPLAPFFRKVLFIGLFAFLINNWESLAAAINQSGAMLGLRAGGSTLTLADLHNPGRVAQIGSDLFGRTVQMGEGMNIITDFVPLATIFIAAICVAIGFYLLALQLFVSLITFKLGALAAFVALPWGVFSGTAWVAERPLGWVAGCAIRLFILAFIASVAIAFVNTLPATLSLDAGGALNVLLFGLTIVALSWFGPALASEVMQGQPSLAGADAYRAGSGAILTGGAAAVGGAYVAAGGVRLAAGGVGLLSRSFNSTGNKTGGGSANPPTQNAPPIDYAKMAPKPAPPPRPPNGGASP